MTDEELKEVYEEYMKGLHKKPGFVYTPHLVFVFTVMSLASCGILGIMLLLSR